MKKRTQNTRSYNAQLTQKVNPLLGSIYLPLRPKISSNIVQKPNNIFSKSTSSVYKCLQSFVFWASISALSISHASPTTSTSNTFSKMSCKELLETLIKTSSYAPQFIDKKNNMGFYSERSGKDRIGLTFVNNAYSPQEMIHANSEIDLLNGTLKLIDSEAPVLIDINKQYIPYIANKCTPDKNEYRRGKYPEPEYDGVLIERHERWKHPVLSIFNKYGFLLNKVSYSMDGTFPTFYIALKYPKNLALDSKAAEKIYVEIIKANSNFPYAIMSQDEKMRIDVGWKDKAKKTIKIDINKGTKTSPIQSDLTKTDLVIVDKIYLSNDVIPMTHTDPSTQIKTAKVLTGNNNVDSFTNKDSIIYYMADISVLHPSKKYYNVTIKCINSKGAIVFQGSVKRSLSGYSYKVGHNIVKGYSQTLGLNPKPGAMIQGQEIPLVGGQNYYIQLLVENKLISMTRFHYKVIKKSSS